MPERLTNVTITFTDEELRRVDKVRRLSGAASRQQILYEALIRMEREYDLIVQDMVIAAVPSDCEALSGYHYGPHFILPLPDPRQDIDPQNLIHNQPYRRPLPPPPSRANWLDRMKQFLRS